MKFLALLTSCLGLCAFGGSSHYTLYRNSPLDTNARYHVASFNASENDKYNSENCNLAVKLFQLQPGGNCPLLVRERHLQEVASE